MSGTWAYYNEWEPFAAEWLRNLIKAGHIAPGVVDERSIVDVCPVELREFRQVHMFAGVGVWSYALRRAGWPDDRSVWTGSCPCQPFSAAGQGAGLADERHLWPFWYHLIDQCNPPDILGEQVASKDAMPWLDLVQDDLEGMGYAFGAVPFPAASVGAPHIRDRLYWVAHADQHTRRQRSAHVRGRIDRGDAQPRPGLSGGRVPSLVAHPNGGHTGAEREQRSGQHRLLAQRGGACILGDAEPVHGRQDEAADHEGAQAHGPADQPRRPGGPLGGFWADAEWIACRDGKARPVEPGSFPLAHGAPARVGRLRAYGNAIVAPQAQAWIETVMECLP